MLPYEAKNTQHMFSLKIDSSHSKEQPCSNAWLYRLSSLGGSLHTQAFSKAACDDSVIYRRT